MANTAPFQFLLMTSILSMQLGVVKLEERTRCSSFFRRFQFECLDKTKCIPKTRTCDGYADCDDGSDESTSLCSPPCSSDDHLFRCKKGKSYVCLNAKFKCDGTTQCDDSADELVSECGGCSSEQFECLDNIKCISKSLICDSYANCDDRSDESTSLCSPPCSTNMFACEDGSKCTQKSQLCSGHFFELTFTQPSFPV